MGSSLHLGSRVQDTSDLARGRIVGQMKVEITIAFEKQFYCCTVFYCNFINMLQIPRITRVHESVWFTGYINHFWHHLFSVSEPHASFIHISNRTLTFDNLLHFDLIILLLHWLLQSTSSRWLMTDQLYGQFINYGHRPLLKNNDSNKFGQKCSSKSGNISI